jgi:SSS family solute:Na+ symporter
MRPEFPLAVLLYVLVLLGVGLRFPKKLQTFESFFLASRSLGAFPIALSLCASWIGAATLLVSTDEAWRDGLGALWIIGIPAVVTLVLFLPLARPLRALSGSTLSDLMEERYGKVARTLTTVLIVWYMMVLASSQMVAGGAFLKTFLGSSRVLSLAAIFAVVLLYSGAGGLLSVVRTHGLQVVLLLAGIGGLLASLLGRVGWHDVRLEALARGKTGYFDLMADGGRNVLIALSFILAWTISPIAWQRIQAAREVRQARKGLLLAAALLAFVYAAIVFAGMLFLPLFSSAPEGRPLVSEFLASESSALPAAVLFLAVMAAILSTMDAALNTGAFCLSRDVLRLSTKTGSAGPLGVSRISTLALGAGAFLIATRFEDILRTLGLASKIMAEGLFIPGLAAVLIKKKMPLAGILSLVLGGGYALICFFEEAGALSLGLPPWPASLPGGVIVSGGGFVLGFVLGKVTGTEKPGA